MEERYARRLMAAAGVAIICSPALADRANWPELLTTVNIPRNECQGVLWAAEHKEQGRRTDLTSADRPAEVDHPSRAEAISLFNVTERQGSYECPMGGGAPGSHRRSGTS
jgi:hypothetical protein